MDVETTQKAAACYVGTIDKARAYDIWRSLNLAAMPDHVGKVLVRCAVERSIPATARAMQRIGHTTVDGIVGPITTAGFLEHVGVMLPEAADLEAAMLAQISTRPEAALIDIALLRVVMKGATGARLAACVTPLRQAAGEFDITSPMRVAAWLATICEESGSLMHTAEDMRYSAARAHEIFSGIFPTVESAVPYCDGIGERLANKVYANRLGNGDERSGDGWRCRGSGFIQLTGRANIWPCLEAFGSVDPAWLQTPEGASLSAGWYWGTHGINRHADLGDFKACTVAVNPARVGWENRVAHYNRARSYFGLRPYYPPE